MEGGRSEDVRGPPGEAHRSPIAQEPMGLDVSIIVPFYNAEPFIERCMRALLAQALPARHEILMVDNNSTDDSAAIVARYPDVTLLREPKQGAYAARNAALRRARGRVVVFTDPDCEAHPGWLQALTAPLEDPSVHVTMGRSAPATTSRALARLSSYDHHKESYIFAAGDPRLLYGRTNNMATRRSTLDLIGPFEEAHRGGDTVFVRRVADRLGCGAIRYVPEARVLHLEIDRLAVYFRKAPLYGRSLASLRHEADQRTLTARERALVFGRTIRSGEVPLRGALPLFWMLAVGVLACRAGGLLERPLAGAS